MPFIIFPTLRSLHNQIGQMWISDISKTTKVGIFSRFSRNFFFSFSREKSKGKIARQLEISGKTATDEELEEMLEGSTFCYHNYVICRSIESNRHIGQITMTFWVMAL